MTNHPKLSAVLDDILRYREIWTSVAFQNLENWDDELGLYPIVGEHLSAEDRKLLQDVLYELLGAALIGVVQAFDASMRAPAGERLVITTVRGRPVCDDWTSALRRRAAKNGSPLPPQWFSWPPPVATDDEPARHDGACG